MSGVEGLALPRVRTLSLRRVFEVLLFVQLANIGIRATLDPDMWWHLRTGQFIFAHGIPRYDVFSFTVPHHEWITHEWLGEAMMWVVYVIGGLPALSVAFAALSALSFWLVYRCSDGKPYLAGLLVLLAAFTAAPCFGVRPQMFSLVMVAAFTYIIEGYRNRRFGRRVLLVLPALTVVWVNLHGGYLLGVALLLAYAAGDGLERLSGGRNARELPWTETGVSAALAGVCLVAAIANPNGWAIWAYPFSTLGSAAMQQNIAEWHSPNFHAYPYWPFAALMGVGVVAWAMTPIRPHCADFVLFLGTALAGLISARHVALFGVVALPIVARSTARLLRGTAVEVWLTGRGGERPSSRGRQRLNWVILGVGLLAAVAWDAKKLAGNDTMIAKTFPVAAVDFLERTGLVGAHGWNSYVWGGYLIWRGIPVFVDGRADVYGDAFVSDYLKTFRLADDWRTPLDDFDVRYVLVERSHALGVLLAASGQWREAYADEVARVFTRR